MEDKLLLRSEVIRQRRLVKLCEFALAAFYRLSHSGDAPHFERIEEVSLVVPEHPKSASAQTLSARKRYEIARGIGGSHHWVEISMWSSGSGFTTTAAEFSCARVSPSVTLISMMR
jgi:hypothetical protein